MHILQNRTKPEKTLGVQLKLQVLF